MLYNKGICFNSDNLFYTLYTIGFLFLFTIQAKSLALLPVSLLSLAFQ